MMSKPLPRFSNIFHYVTSSLPFPAPLHEPPSLPFRLLLVSSLSGRGLPPSLTRLLPPPSLALQVSHFFPEETAEMLAEVFSIILPLGFLPVMVCTLHLCWRLGVT